MATDDIFATANQSLSIPKVNILTMFRLGLFQMGLSMMSILTLGVLNRVMIQEIAIPATIGSLVLAIPYFIAPTRILFGQISDNKPLLGYHRTAYVWVGAGIFAIAAFLAVQIMWQLNGANIGDTWVWTNQTIGWTGVLGLVFAIYGLAICASGTAFAALLVDISEEDNRSQVVGIVWSMLMVGIIIGAIISSTILKELTANAPIETLQAAINRLFVIVPSIVFSLAIIATVGVEKKYSRFFNRVNPGNREDSITLKDAWKILTASPQTGLFFTFLLVMTISLFMQDPILEPYAGQVFKMSLAESTKLNVFYGTGILISYGITGFFIVPRLGKRRTIKLGCILVAFAALLIACSGFSANPSILKSTLVLFGLATGFVTTAAVTLMLDLTIAEAAGTFIGAWGLAQSMSRGIATVTGGAILDIGRKLLPDNLVLAYGMVFGLEAVGMLISIWFLNRVNVTEFKTNTKQVLASVLESDLDN
ncbi:BCD family MFS transporter [Aphanizomenon flos-aquae NRERC-008]|uniref:BCD family MFS transporter n=1 Tax=Aphanizomenon flos-aquae FACHB-1249 TaxID=2692889 RepID=A0ABR8IRX9_APHFL|nr:MULTISPECIES: BCD family MFS transporter [Aphanizomenon]MBD2389216.1 BCD family MFS transporter [Aphanizomenon flos-aquae FACHB-1171]MBD2555409.1 BCD family MFS transporter [Aphanizomenon flos-aquae FACHB-1290]MBD2631584.1 BCD family MFS transporter [Aphanizomenon sp. FACHB-1399]MBD2642310.1 BCD family MFS transporter [Aphanizomenon sp. FACHB-1401]MBD2656259.1 BCD family MFS transporter [Aphanizomenon flos-aquae FACHB-1265]